MEDFPRHFNSPAIRIKHADLKRHSDESFYKSKCPSCKEGILVMRRDQKTLKLLAEDQCFGCGQAFIYDDIEILRKGEGK